MALYAMQAKGLDTGDKPLATAIAFRVVQALRMQEKRGKITGAGKSNGRRIWALPVSSNVILVSGLGRPKT